MTERTKSTQLFSIGALARAAGVPVETLRTWERRYGTPSPERTESGHRRYSLATLDRLRLVRAAIQAGHRASVALTIDEPGLRALLANRPLADNQVENLAERLPLPSSPEPPQEDARGDARVERCLDLIKRYDGRGLDRELSSGLAALGALTFMESQVSPLLHEVGERWRRAELRVCHEHFASERLHEFLARQWQPLSDAASGPISVCATPAGEHHTLGLQMAAYTLSLNNLRVVYLGANLPAADLAAAVTHHAARVTLLSAALGADTERLYAECAQVRAAVGPDVTILTGGGGFQPAPEGTTGMTSLRALSDWARSFCLTFSPN